MFNITVDHTPNNPSKIEIVSDLNQSQDTSCHDLDCLTQEIANLLYLTTNQELNINKLLRKPKYQNLVSSIHIHEQIIRHLDSSSYYDKKFILALKELLNSLSTVHLESSNIALFHSYKSLHVRLSKARPEHLNLTLQALRELNQLNSSTLLLEIYLNEFLVHLDALKANKLIQERLNILLNKLESLSLQLQQQRQKASNLYFVQLKDKSVEEHLLQTIKALQINCLYPIENLLIKLENRYKKPQVIIFTCSYGTGHKVTAAAIQETLKSAKIDSIIIDLSTGALLGRDRIHKIFKVCGINYNDHPLNSVDVFNEILKNQFYSIINTKDSIDLFIRKMLDIHGKSGVAPRSSVYKNSWEKTQLRDLLLMQQPNHIITTYHMDLNPILEVAEELNLPLLHIPTDYNMKYDEVFGTTPTSYPHFRSLIPNSSVPATLTTQYPLPDKCFVQNIGIPLRTPFYQSLERKQAKTYRKKLNLKSNEKVLFLSTGGNGQHLPHPELLANSTTWNMPLRLEIIVGKNKEFVEYLQNKLVQVDNNPFLLRGQNPYVTVEIVVNPDPAARGTDREFYISANEISKIMDISDAAIAKAGGLSTAELLFKGIPILFDQRVRPFSWELFNIQVVTAAGRGLSNYNTKTLEQDLLHLLAIPKEIDCRFHFENGPEMLINTILEQIQATGT